MERAGEKLQPDDSVDDDDEHDEKSDVEQRHHSLHDGVQHHLKTWNEIVS